MFRSLPLTATGSEARPDGFEPPTTWFEARCSIQLSYGRMEIIVAEQCPTDAPKSALSYCAK